MYLALMEGADPTTTRPVLITRDPELLEAFAEALESRVREGRANGSAHRALELVREESEGDGGE